MKWLLVFLVALATVATGFKACSNSLFVEGHPHSHVKPTSPKAAQNIGSFIAEYEPSIRNIEIEGKEYKISKAWAEYRTKLSHRLIWFPFYPRTEGIHVTIEFEDDIPVDNQGLKNVPFWLNLETGRYTYLSKNQFTGMSDGEPRTDYTFVVTNRLTKDEITRIQLKKK
jgi:hypothetical protein